eukprot:13298730-Heterocapsa_arctica.AAC.1
MLILSNLEPPREGSWRPAMPSSRPPLRLPGLWHRGYKPLGLASTLPCWKARARVVEDQQG